MHPSKHILHTSLIVCQFRPKSPINFLAVNCRAEFLFLEFEISLCDTRVIYFLFQ